MSDLESINDALDYWGLDRLDELPEKEYGVFKKFLDNCALDFVINRTRLDPEKLDWSEFINISTRRELRDAIVTSCLESDEGSENIYELLSSGKNNKVIKEFCGISRRDLCKYWNVLTEGEKLGVFLSTELIIDVMKYKMDEGDDYTLPSLFTKWIYLIGASVIETAGKFRLSMSRVRVNTDYLRDIKR